MNISVACRSRSGASEPARLCLGRCCLPVTDVRALADQPDSAVYEVRVLDGRRFVVRRQIAQDRWELVAVYERAPARRAPSRINRALAALILILLALSRKAIHLARRGIKLRSELPPGGAPA